MTNALAQVFLGGEDALPSWKSTVGAISAYLTALLFIVAGVWKLTEIGKVSQMFEQLLIPGSLSVATVVLVAAFEMTAAILLVMPKTRRLGGILVSAMLVAFLLYFAIFYNRLQGAECSCFPWVKRTVGPAFFISDAAMLAVALLAAVFSLPSRAFRMASAIFAACLLLSVSVFAVDQMRNTDLKAPDSITVDSKPYALDQGQVFIYFFDPECSHCFQVAKDMSAWKWGNTKVIAVPTREARFAQGFLDDTKLKASISNDLDLLQQTFKFVSGPYGVALLRGRQKTAISVADFESGAAKNRLHDLGFIGE